MTYPRRPAARTVVRCAVLGVPLVVLLLLPRLVEEPLARARSGQATVDDLASVVAAGGVGLVLLWVLVALTAILVSGIRPRTGGTARTIVGRAAEFVVQRLTPEAGRRAAAIALGVTLAGGSVSAYGGATSRGHDLRPAVVAAAAEALAVGRPSSSVEQAALAPSSFALAVDRPAVDMGPEAQSSRWTPPPLERVVRTKPLAPVRVVAAVPREAEALTDEIVVRRGDTLWSVAARHLGAAATDAEVAAEWPRWYAANRGAIGTDPDLILVGTVLRPPTA